MLVAHNNGAPIGLIQRYRFDAYPQYITELAHIMAVPNDAFSVDYFIGPLDALRQGQGGALAPDNPVDDMNHVPYQLDRPG